jgi:hypothetical protein
MSLSPSPAYLASFFLLSLVLSVSLCRFSYHFSLGEGATDAGGPYRDCLSTICNELQSPANRAILPLLIPTPNAREGVGQNTDQWMLNPSLATEEALQQYTFLGYEKERERTQRENRGETQAEAERQRQREGTRNVHRIGTFLTHFLCSSKLMGIAIRTETPLSLDLSPLLWKHLVGSPPTELFDLAHIDVRMTELLKQVKKL